MNDIRRYEGTREYLLFRKEAGFGDVQYVWDFGVFTYDELMNQLNDGWRCSKGCTVKKLSA